MIEINEYQRMALDELIDEYSLNPALFKTGAVHRLLCSLQDSRSAGKELAALLGYQDFEWVDFDRCASFCEKYQLSPSAYWFLDKKPQQPETLSDFLAMLTVPEIKKLAKEKGISGLSARKAEIIEKVCAVADLPDFKQEVNEVLKQREEQYREDLVVAKCEALAQDIYNRASSIEQIERDKERNLAWRYSIYCQHESEKEMAYLMMGGYHLAEDGDGGLKRLPPFFPGDTSWVSKDLDREKRREIIAERIKSMNEQPAKVAKPIKPAKEVIKPEKRTPIYVYVKWFVGVLLALIVLGILKNATAASLIRMAFFIMFTLAAFFIFKIFRNRMK